eukprot:352853-Chlamydomonas_euryale.AAC.4
MQQRANAAAEQTLHRSLAPSLCSGKAKAGAWVLKCGAPRQGRLCMLAATVIAVAGATATPTATTANSKACS